MRWLWYKTINKVKEVYRIMTDPNKFLTEIETKSRKRPMREIPLVR